MAQGNDRLDSYYFLLDTKCDDNEPNKTNFVEIDIGGENSGGENSDSFAVGDLVIGSGTAGDTVRIEYYTDGLNKVSADSKNGTVSQKEWSVICVNIDCDDCARDTDGGICIDVEKCKVEGSLKVDSSDECSGDASATCSGTDLYSFLSDDQVTSIEAAFPKGNKCGVKIDAKDPGKKSSIKIKLKAKKNTDSCRAVGNPG